MSLNYGKAIADLYGKEGVSLGGAASGQFEEDDVEEEEEEENWDGGAGEYDAEESDPYDDYDEY